MAREQKFALVTGCGRGGIGESLVLEYDRQGVHPIATVLPNENAEHLVDAGITFFRLDVTVEESVTDLKASLQKLTGGYLDILVNCAGIAYTMTAIDTDVRAVQRMFDINLFGPMRMVHSFHDMIIRAEGAIVNIGSIGGIIPFMYGSSYNASKAALAHWGNSLRVELAPLGVKVITVISGEVSTNILKNDAHRKLPEEGATDRFKYASNVVAQSLKSSPPVWYWYGSFTKLTRFLDTFAWRSIWDIIMWKMFDLEKLRKAHRSALKKYV
ncbi:hypothetical protein F5Y15DRAFT_424970 [Xylariaceae sp. FL0016]|nr:hypothetical protein F5Y15DRAFT_424970 [Xylariaceae sp. FL0016]